MLKTQKVLLFCSIISIYFTITALAQETTATGRNGAGTGRGVAAGRGGSRNDPRVENRTYLFTDTNETLPYAVFTSSKVTKDKKAPLIIALRGAGGNPTVFLQRPALELAEEGGYILVGVMGYNSTGSYGMPVTGGMMGGRRGMNGPMFGATPERGNAAMRGGNRRGGTGGSAATDPAKISEYSEKDVMNVLEMIRKEFNIDEKRIYLVGHSQGGAGAIHLAEKYSSIWAAAAMLSPGAPNYQMDKNAKFKDVPLLIMVGENDNLIATPRMIDKELTSMKIDHEYKEMSGEDHGSIIMAAMPDVFEFFAKHTKQETKQDN